MGIELEVQGKVDSERMYDGAMDGDEGTNAPADTRAAAVPVAAEAVAPMAAAADNAPAATNELVQPILSDDDKSYEKIMEEQANLMKQIENENAPVEEPYVP